MNEEETKASEARSTPADGTKATAGKEESTKWK